MSLGQKGQAQILLAMGMGTLMLSAGLYALQSAQNTGERELKNTQLSEMHAVLDLAIRHAGRLYVQAGCDPIALETLLENMNPDGSIQDTSTSPPATRRQMSISYNQRDYTVGFAGVRHINWTGDPNPGDGGGSTIGFAQDAVVEVWTHYGDQLRLVQGATLINTCVYRCSADYGTSSAPCTTGEDAAIAYHRITDPTNFPTGGGFVPTPGCLGGGQSPGDINIDGQIDIIDLLILKNYLRSGDVAGSTRNTIVGTGVGGFGCADLNRDLLINEEDLAILEKVLRGYLYRLTTR